MRTRRPLVRGTLLTLVLAGLTGVAPSETAPAAGSEVVRKPTKISVYDRGSGFLRVRWHSGHASAGIRSYCVRIPGLPHRCTRSQRITLTGLRSRTGYTVQVRLKDHRGRFSGWTGTRVATRREPARWTHPLPGAFASSCYGPRGDGMHNGMDLVDSYRAPVRSAGRGIVVGAGWNTGGFGWQVVVSHGRGVYTRYGHLDSIAVRKGQRVRAGQTVGRQGNTGASNGSHLHLEVWRGGWHRPVNPGAFLAGRGVSTGCR